uniref:2-C-methyl-D-erythritol 4-phosphate cytidylyltransferase n=1 Tax=Bixa orellana TaxID=66672 RepID=A0A9Y1EIA8_BIXOR|nr:2-C-methyl-D-erythritol 4-phosphate cytidylyltransferase [Bixa orellana]
MITAIAMKRIPVAFCLASFLYAQIPFGVASPSTVPAFLWSPQLLNHESKESVNYRIISPKDLVQSVLSEGGWSNLLCSAEELKQPVDLALVFVGRELHSSDIVGSKHEDPALLDMLKASFIRSNFSMAFPYVATSEEDTMENLLVSGFTQACGQGLGVSSVAFSESCSVEGGDFQRLANLDSVHDHLASRMEKRTEGQTDLVVFCQGGSRTFKELDQPNPESVVLSEVIKSVEQSGAKYAALYISDPIRSIHYPSYREFERFLAEEVKNESTNSTSCDEVCQIKSSLLEGVLVGVVLLLILISGLCCMMGIDTPARFEAPQDS